jgi:hypothetical protein
MAPQGATYLIASFGTWALSPSAADVFLGAHAGAGAQHHAVVGIAAVHPALYQAGEVPFHPGGAPHDSSGYGCCPVALALSTVPEVGLPGHAAVAGQPGGAVGRRMDPSLLPASQGSSTRWALTAAGAEGDRLPASFPVEQQLGFDDAAADGHAGTGRTGAGGRLVPCLRVRMLLAAVVLVAALSASRLGVAATAVGAQGVGQGVARGLVDLSAGCWPGSRPVCRPGWTVAVRVSGEPLVALRATWYWSPPLPKRRGWPAAL